MPKLAANLSWLFTELDYMDRFAAAAGAGFKGVECLFPYDHGAAHVAARLADHGLEQVLINAPPGDWEGGERGLGCLPGCSDDFRASMEKAVEYAVKIGCPRIHAMAGIAPVDADPAILQGVFAKNLALAADLCGQAGITVMIEPINRTDMPGYFLSHPDQAAALIAEVASPHLGLQFDIYHAAMMGLDIAGHLKSHFAVIGHIQVAGFPGRGEPVAGDVDYPGVFDMIDGLGYSGWIGCEYRPLGTTLAGLSWAQSYGIMPRP